MDALQPLRKPLRCANTQDKELVVPAKKRSANTQDKEFTPAKKAALAALALKTPNKTFMLCNTLKNSPSPPVWTRRAIDRHLERGQPPLLFPMAWVDAVSLDVARCAAQGTPARPSYETFVLCSGERSETESAPTLWSFACGTFGCFGAGASASTNFEDGRHVFTPAPTAVYDVDAPDTTDRYDFLSPDVSAGEPKAGRRSIDHADQSALICAQ